MLKIQEAILKKHGLKKSAIGKQPRRGRVKDNQIHKLSEVFDITVSSIYNYRRGAAGVGRQRLFAVMRLMSIELLNYIQGEIYEIQ